MDWAASMNPMIDNTTIDFNYTSSNTVVRQILHELGYRPIHRRDHFLIVVFTVLLCAQLWTYHQYNNSFMRVVNVVLWSDRGRGRLRNLTTGLPTCGNNCVGNKGVTIDTKGNFSRIFIPRRWKFYSSDALVPSNGARVRGSYGVTHTSIDTKSHSTLTRHVYGWSRVCMWPSPVTVLHGQPNIIFNTFYLIYCSLQAHGGSVSLTLILVGKVHLRQYQRIFERLSLDFTHSDWWPFSYLVQG